MKQKNLEVYYDEEADILEIFIGKPTETYFDEIADDLFEGKDEKTDELKGFKIFNFRKRAVNGMREVRIPLPANVEIKEVN
ncbi:hypothetical protein B6U80_01710 [Candidatus Pacearchaeota archaeon ex4484_26]|nr:MAG: hypothetical protein B6U80_01710 [Candidatus Pacearchaeota archaeon ex4484_26]